ncbi:hypothetical protein HDU97_005035 [Phlyctochytrium planicorne]|nr:hypothetical protein HDU97_005035 [Phlyctochytrium planicorne]
MWAVGAILAEMFTLRPLFPGSSEMDQIYKICQVIGSPLASEPPGGMVGDAISPTAKGGSIKSYYGDHRPMPYRDGIVGGGVWPEGIKLASAMRFKFPAMQAVPLSQFIPNASGDALELIGDMLKYDPHKRPTAIEALQHPWFKKLQDSPLADVILPSPIYNSPSNQITDSPTSTKPAPPSPKRRASPDKSYIPKRSVATPSFSRPTTADSYDLLNNDTESNSRTLISNANVAVDTADFAIEGRRLSKQLTQEDSRSIRSAKGRGSQPHSAKSRTKSSRAASGSSFRAKERLSKPEAPMDDLPFGNMNFKKETVPIDTLISQIDDVTKDHVPRGESYYGAPSYHHEEDMMSQSRRGSMRKSPTKQQRAPKVAPHVSHPLFRDPPPIEPVEIPRVEPQPMYSSVSNSYTNDDYHHGGGGGGGGLRRERRALNPILSKGDDEYGGRMPEGALSDPNFRNNPLNRSRTHLGHVSNQKATTSNANEDTYGGLSDLNPIRGGGAGGGMYGQRNSLVPQSSFYQQTNSFGQAQGYGGGGAGGGVPRYGYAAPAAKTGPDYGSNIYGGGRLAPGNVAIPGGRLRSRTNAVDPLFMGLVNSNEPPKREWGVVGSSVHNANTSLAPIQGGRGPQKRRGSNNPLPPPGIGAGGGNGPPLFSSMKGGSMFPAVEVKALAINQRKQENPVQLFGLNSKKW